MVVIFFSMEDGIVEQCLLNSAMVFTVGVIIPIPVRATVVFIVFIYISAFVIIRSKASPPNPREVQRIDLMFLPFCGV